MALQKESQYKQEYMQNKLFHNKISPVMFEFISCNISPFFDS